MAEQVIITDYADGSRVMSNIRNAKGIPIVGLNSTYTATRVSTWYDGSPMTNDKCDGLVYLRHKASGGYYKVNLPNEGELFLEKDTMQEMRDLNSTEILLLQMGYYKGVKLNGYHAKGDTPAPIEYFLSSTTEEDNSGNIIELPIGLKLKYNFIRDINIRYFGAKLDYNTTSREGTDDTLAWKNAISEQNKSGNRYREILFEGRSMVSETLVINQYTIIKSINPPTSGVYSSIEEGNIIEYKNGYVVEDGVVVNWGSFCNAQLYRFEVGSTIRTETDEFGRQLTFVPVTGIHIEGLRYRGKLEGIRVTSALAKGVYLFGSWGTKVTKSEFLNLKQGLEFDSGVNGIGIEECTFHRCADINDVINSGAILFAGLGDAENQRGNGNNISIRGTIIERGFGSPAIKGINVNNLSIRDTYIERQTSNQRSVILVGCNTVNIDNVNIENSLGLQLQDCQGVSINGLSCYTSNGDLILNNAITLIGNNNKDINIVNSYYDKKPIRLTTTTLNANTFLTLEQAQELSSRPQYTLYNHFVDPVFMKQSPFSKTGAIDHSYRPEGLRLIFPVSNTYDFIGYHVGGYTSVSSGEINLIVHVSVLGKGTKRLTMTKTSGSAVTRDFDFEGEGFLLIRTPTGSAGGVLHNFRIGVLSDNEEEVTITVKGVYLGEYNYSALLREGPVPNATSELAGVVKQSAVVEDASVWTAPEIVPTTTATTIEDLVSYINSQLVENVNKGRRYMAENRSTLNSKLLSDRNSGQQAT